MYNMKCITLTASRFLILLSVSVYHIHGQVAPSGQVKPSLQDVFENIAKDPSALPEPQEFEKLEMGIPTAPPQEIRNALPAIMTTLRNDNDAVKHYAGVALISIGTRGDSAELLRPYLNDLTDLLNSPRVAIQSGGLTILALLRPAPPPEVFPTLLRFANRKDGEPSAQVGAVGLLLRYRADDPGVVQAVHDFALRRLDTSTRMSMLKAIRLSRTNDPQIQDVVVRSLEDSNPGVKISAVEALNRMGKAALIKAEPDLRKLAQSPDEHPEVKAAAKKALKSLEGETH